MLVCYDIYEEHMKCSLPSDQTVGNVDKSVNILGEREIVTAES
jgi:hypothetical protein